MIRVVGGEGQRPAPMFVLGRHRIVDLARSLSAISPAGATDLATRMVREFGMSSAIGPVGFASDGPRYLGREELRRPYAEATQRAIDEEVVKLLRQAEERASDLLRSHQKALADLTQQLIDHETVDGLAVYELLVERPLDALRNGNLPLKDAS